MKGQTINKQEDFENNTNNLQQMSNYKIETLKLGSLFKGDDMWIAA